MTNTNNNESRVVPSTMDIHVDQIPNQTITRDEYKRLGGVPTRGVYPSDAPTPLWDEIELSARERPAHPREQFNNGETNPPSQKPQG